ncbi:MAG: dual specificity protein phosphatase family protein [Candidatus Eremiobacteraeota bacterium]|nr:dual specificity protein phosphatase family protein [Candidatus Eremiobacteraeota bacterium]
MLEKKHYGIALVGHNVCAFKDVDSEAVRRADAIVSIGDPGEAMPAAIVRSRKRRLRLSFYDLDHEARESPQVDHVRELINFVKTVKADDRLLVHCYAGISRSTASLAIIFTVLYPELDHDVIFEAVHAIRPEAWPNKRMIAFADDILNCGGRFTSALLRFRSRVIEDGA